MIRVILALSFIVATFSVSSAQAAADAIRKADQDWLRVFAAKDQAKSVDFVIADGSVLAPNAPIANGHGEIHKLFAGFFALPDLRIEWSPNRVEAARSGEMGYSTGTYQMSFKDPSGKTIEDRGKYVMVWKKQRGQWKVAYDIFNSDLAPGQ